MKADEQRYKALNEKELTRWEMLDLTFAMKELADGIGGHNAWDTLRHTRNAIQHLQEFRGKLTSAPDLTQDEANLSSGLHTYMRKGMDCPLGTMLYQLISENRGTNIWYSFIRALNALVNSPKMSNPTPQRLYQTAISAAESTYGTGSDTTNDLFMLSALRLWEADFECAMNWLEPEE